MTAKGNRICHNLANMRRFLLLDAGTKELGARLFMILILCSNGKILQNPISFKMKQKEYMSKTYDL